MLPVEEPEEQAAQQVLLDAGQQERAEQQQVLEDQHQHQHQHQHEHQHQHQHQHQGYAEV